MRKVTRYPIRGVCNYCYQKVWHVEHPDSNVKGNAIKSAKYAVDPEYAEKSKERIRTHWSKLSTKEQQCRRLKYNLMAKYRTTPEQLDAQVAAQGNMCAVCNNELERARAHIDHDHKCCPGQLTCGKCLRGILCGSCNKALGLFKDDVKALSRAITYIQNGGVWT